MLHMLKDREVHITCKEKERAWTFDWSLQSCWIILNKSTGIILDIENDMEILKKSESKGHKCEILS